MAEFETRDVMWDYYILLPERNPALARYRLQFLFYGEHGFFPPKAQFTVSETLISEKPVYQYADVRRKGFWNRLLWGPTETARVMVHNVQVWGYRSHGFLRRVDGPSVLTADWVEA